MALKTFKPTTPSQRQLVLVDRTVSRKHAEVRRERDFVIVRDLGSTNGTFYHDARVVDGRTLAGLVDLWFADRGDDHEVGRSRAEPVPQQGLGPGGLGGRIAEPACRQSSEHPGSDRPGQGEEDGGGGEDGTGPAQRQESDRSEHGDLRQVGLRCRWQQSLGGERSLGVNRRALTSVHLQLGVYACTLTDVNPRGVDSD